MSDDIVQRGLETFRQAAIDRDRLQGEVDHLTRACGLYQADTDRLNLVVVQLSAERDMYQCRCAVLGNELSIIKHMIVDAERKARADSFGRPEMAPIDDDAALAQISYTRRRQN